MGGAIKVDRLMNLSSYLFQNDLFYNNTSEFAGALLLHHLSGSGIINTCQFLSNQALQLIVKPVSAGALDIWGEKETIAFSAGNIFINNYSEKFVGACVIFGGKLISTNETYINNSAGEKGGTVIIYFGYLIMTDSVFINSSSQDGGTFTIFDISIAILNNISKITHLRVLWEGLYRFSGNLFCV